MILAALCAAPFGTAVGAAAPVVVTVSPARQRIDTPALAPIVVDFDTPLKSSTVMSQTFRVFGRWSGPAAGALSLENGQTRVRFNPSQPFFAGEWVTVSLSTSIEASDGTAMAQSYAFNFWIRTETGSLLQELRTTVPIRDVPQTHIQSYGAYAGDLNNDGYSDLAVPNEITSDIRVFLNDGAGDYGPFTIYPLLSGNTPSGNEGGDFDGDGEIDLAVASGGSDKISVLKGDGAGGFLPEVSYAAGFSVRGVGVLDLNGDGHDDLVTANRVGNNLSLLLNDGTGLFGTSTSAEANSTHETACATADANNDGIMDVFVGSYTSEEFSIMLGDGVGGLSFSSKVPSGGQCWMIAVGDINGDGNVDVASANSFDNHASVAFGDGSGGLSPATTYPTGGFPLAIDLGDLDGDGDLDLVTSNFWGVDWTIYENDGSGVFVNPVTLDASAAGSCAILHDRDNDGDLDITGIDELSDLIFVFENTDIPTDSGQPPSARRLAVSSRPNPFNPSTTISYEVPTEGDVTLAVYDIGGHLVETLVAGLKPAGPHQVSWRPSRVASGVYIVRLVAGNEALSHKVILLK